MNEALTNTQRGVNKSFPVSQFRLLYPCSLDKYKPTMVPLGLTQPGVCHHSPPRQKNQQSVKRSVFTTPTLFTLALTPLMPYINPDIQLSPQAAAISTHFTKYNTYSIVSRLSLIE